MASFVDRVTLHARGGNGGHGVASIHREKFKPLGGPDGANGGDGGSVILRVDSSTTTLLDLQHRPHRQGGNGGQGAGDMRNGKQGEDVVLPVPDGTVVKDGEGNVLADLVGEGAQWVVALGGKGGLGNAALASPKRKAPGFALLGEPGEEVDVILELKTLADVALVGFPSAGKSSLVAAISAARPKIADYPFTTLIPNLGVVQAGEMRFTVADVPGLIPGASTGKGLGLEFLRHIERCAVVVHVVDCATLEPGRDPVSDIELIEAELGAYASDLGIEGGRVPLNERPRVVVLNKMDVPQARELADFVRPEIAAKGWPVFEISTATHEGLRPLIFALAGEVTQARANLEPLEPARPVLRPRPVDSREDFKVSRRQSDHVYYLITGEKPQRWVRQTNFTNDEAVGYLADRLAAIGIEEALFKAGAQAGDEVVIGDGPSGVIFDWEPTLLTGPELLGARGSDLRLEDRHRPTRAQKREEYHARQDARTAQREGREEGQLWNERE